MAISSVSSYPGKVVTNGFTSFYSYREQIGEGSFARVYKGTNLSSHSLCAIKCYDRDEVGLEEGQREIRNLLNLSEAPHVVQCIDYIQVRHGSGPLIIEEFVEGGDLSKNYRRFTLQDIITTAKQALEALAYFHSRNLIYCDLKFENTLWKTDKYIKFADFGSMRPSHEPAARIVTAYNRAIEVFLGGPYTTSLDMFSFGTFLFRLITQKELFEIPNYDDNYFDSHCSMIQLLCEQCGYPSQEQLELLRYTKSYFTFSEKGEPQLSYRKKIQFTPWKTMVQEACLKREFDPFTSRCFIDLISRCLTNQERITAADALRHRLFRYEMSFSVVSNIRGSRPFILTLYKKGAPSTYLLKVDLTNTSALRCLHLSGYSSVECRLTIGSDLLTLHEEEITIEANSNLSITTDKESNFQVTILKGAGQQLPARTTASIGESKRRDSV